MVKIAKKILALKLRKQGKSYNQIKEVVGVSKGTLSLWLRDYPLSKKRLSELRDNNPQRIAKYRETMRNKKETRLATVKETAEKDIGCLSKRDIFIAGLCLYWGEGLKVMDATTSMANTDPHTLLFFIKWLDLIGVKRSQLKARLHLYADMNVEKETAYWSKKLCIKKEQFRKPYIKKSKTSDVKYRNPYSHGTCNIIFDNRDVNEYTLMVLEVMKEKSLNLNKHLV